MRSQILRPLARALPGLAILFCFVSRTAFGACGATTRTWDGGGNGNTSWGTAKNWTADNAPDTTAENAVVVSAGTSPSLNASFNIGCLTITSGLLTTTNGQTLTISGDYFRNLTTNQLNFRAADTATFIAMAGAGDQTFENVDPINNLRLSTNNTVTVTNPFQIRNSLSWNAGNTGKLLLSADVTINSGASALTIPASAMLEVGAGQTFTVNASITVAGTLKLNAGSRLVLSNGATLSVSAGGILQLAGADGNVATIRSTGAGATFTLNVIGQVNADYFRIDRMTANGLNVTGSIQKLDHGEFHYIAANGHAVTLGAAASAPTTFNTLGFFNDESNTNAKNLNASSFAGSAITVSNWSGDVGGATFETDTNKVNWGAPAPVQLLLSNNTAAGNPAATLGRSSADTLFTTFAFSLNQLSTSTDITSVTLTQTGTASSADLLRVRVYRDAVTSNNCAYNAGTDVQIGSDLTLSGSTPAVTFSIPPGDVATDSPNGRGCLHVLAATSAVARNGATIQFGIQGTSDVTNSQGYAFSASSGPPVAGGTSTVSAGTESVWEGSKSDAWGTKNNWNPTTIPTAAVDCRVGSASNVARLSSALQSCLNAVLQTGGTVNFNSTTNGLDVYGSLDVATGFTFSNATAGPGVLTMKGANSQSLKLRSAFPGSFAVSNTGASGDDIVSVDADSTLSGTTTLTNGVLRVSGGTTLTVLGNLTVQTGAELRLEPGATLTLGNGTTLTVNAGGTLTLVGNATQSVNVTSNGPSDTYSVVVNGTISANYYSFTRLGVNGLSIEAGATIDATNHLQNGAFSAPVTNNSTFLKLKLQVPGDAIDALSFESSGSSATGVKNIDTTGASAGTLTISSYSGDLAGVAFDVDPSYGLSWTGATNTIDISQEATGPGSVNAGSTYTMGRFGLKQNQASASFFDTDVTTFKLTLTGTGSPTDISEVRLYYDSACSGSGGTVIGAGTFTGNPGTVTFSPGAGQVTVPADASSPPMRCVYVVFDVAAGATGGNTIGVKLNSSSDFVTSQGYAVSGSTTLPVTLGTASTIVGSSSTTWTGTTNTNWFTATNWSAGLPSATKDCQIDDAANDPIVNGAGGTATCKSLSIGNGTLTLQNGTGAVLSVRGNLSNTGTLTQNDGTLRIEDAGAGTAQTVSSSTTINALTFSKTGGGTVTVAGTTLTVNTLTFPGGSTFTFVVPGSKTLILPNGVSVAAGTLEVQGGGNLQIGNGQTLTVNGGTFKTTGVNDGYPQTTSNKANLTVFGGGAGTWAFSATSGTVSLVGFLIDKLGNNGLVIGGTTTLTQMNGGQLTSLSASYASMKALQINTSSVPATVSNFGWNWGPEHAVPAASDAYTLAYSSGCGGNTVTFDQWFGDFDMDVDPPPTAQSKVSTTNCTLTVSAANSPVTFHSLSAAGYDGAVAVRWRTTVETAHEGFNVYRSTNPLYGYIQVNRALIRNILASGSAAGEYRYVDADVENGTTYYYLVEDVAVSGSKERHGPVFATPDGSLGSVPAPSGSTNTAESSTGANDGNTVDDTGVSANTGVKDLGNGAHVLAQTSRAFRLEIIPPPAEFSASDWNGAYQKVSVPGYSSTLEAGKAEVPERVLLVEVPSTFSTAAVTAYSVTEVAAETKLLQPAPSWAVDGGGTLVPSYSPNAAAYSVDADYPAAFYSVDATLVTVQSKKYVKVKVNPILFHGSTSQVRRATRILLDVGLDGNDWTPSAPSSAAALSPASVEGSVRVRFAATGMYEVWYEDLEAQGIDGTLAGIPISDLRAYSLGQEIPLEIVDSDGFFGSGDQVRFWGNRVRSFEDPYSEIVLSRFSLGDSGGPAKRFATLAADPSGQTATSLATTFARAEFEEDLREVFDVPMGSFVDHLYWVRIYHQQGAVPDANAFHNFSLTLPSLQADGGHTVRVRAALRGRGNLSVDPVNHVGFWVNASERLAEVSFRDTEPTEVTAELPSYYFVPGVNRVRLEAIADGLKAGEYQLIDVDRLTVEYRANRRAAAGVAELFNESKGVYVTTAGFDPDSDLEVQVYDVSNPDSPVRLTAVSRALGASGDEDEVSFLVGAGADESLGYHLVAIQDGSFLVPDRFQLVEGFPQALKSSSRGADLIVIGREPLLEAAEPLVERRESEGMRVVPVTPEQIYAEFSHGQKSSEAFREFLKYARTGWSGAAPKYVLLLGDGTYDASDRLEYGRKDLLPMPLERGTYDDFGSDHWFVADETTNLPTMAIGRIPTEDPAAVASYVTKLLAYEDGDRAPTSASLSFIVDKDSLAEDFAGKASALSSGALALRPDFSVETVLRNDFATDGAAKASLLGQFGEAPLLMTYVGHGAENLWRSDQFFENADASALTNERLPLVVGLNCLNSLFYYPDPEQVSLGESLVLNASGGAIGFWGSTSLTSPTSQVALSSAFQNELAGLTAEPGETVRVGEVMVRAKSALGDSPAVTDTMRSWTFLGDPSLKVPRSAFGPARAATSETAAAQTVAMTDDGGGCLRARGPARSGRKLEFLITALLFCLPVLGGRLYLRRRT